MAELVTIARPYAEAVARLAKEHSAWTAWSGMLAAASAVVQDAQVADLIANPSVPAERAGEVVVAVCGKKLDEQGTNFVKLLAENKRLAVLPQITAAFEEMKASAEGVLEAQVTTAYPLSDAQMAALVGKLEGKYGRKITATQAQDSELIGGVVIQVGDEVLDASVRAKLAEMSVTLNG